ncbi:glycosyltransferase family 4 protein [Lysinibacillus sphaericus]
MKKNIWIWNHYASNMYKDQAGRHYWFAENLKKQGYNPTIFCASTIHNSNENIDTGSEKYTTKIIDEIPFTFVKTPSYFGNGRQRITNMITFYKNLFSVSKEYAKIHGKPDVILASSVHPLTLVAGIKIAKKFGIPCICEIRDLWPETIVAYGSLRKNSLFAKLLYLGEKWIYEKADKLVFTMEGGKDYIADNGWDVDSGGSINLNKVHHINNGVDLELFEYNKKYFTVNDDDLDNDENFKVIYAGSIRKANNLQLVIDAAKYVNDNSKEKIKFLIFGDGDEKKHLEDKCKQEFITNVIFKGKVNKNYIPYIVSKSNLNILNYSSHDIWKYGGSQNKNFEYLAAGKPILSTITMGYDILKKYEAGISLNTQTKENIGKSIIGISKMPKADYELISSNARKAAENYDFKVLTHQLIDIIENC